MTSQAPLKKTAAIRTARKFVSNPVLLNASQFVVRLPSDARRPDSELIDVVTANYAQAQRARAYAVARMALALMGLEHIPLQPEEGSTIEQLIDAAMQRSRRQAATDEAPLPFWQVRIR